MRVLLGTVIAGSAKAYAVPKFEEMCRELLPDIDVLAVVDDMGQTTLPRVVDERTRNTPWATEIVYHGKNTLKQYALGWGYDALVWQGIDCYYNSREDFNLLVRGVKDHPIIGGLVAGRNRPDYAVCRRFVANTTKQRDHIEERHLRPFQGIREVRGYIGSDATAIRRDALETVTMDGYEHWHTLRDDPDALGPEEWFMWSAITRHGITPVIDARVRPWHAHENHLLARYPNHTRQLKDLTWPG